MKKLSALLLSLLLLLTACGAPGQPDNAAPSTPDDALAAETALCAKELPEACRVWFDIAETSGTAEKDSKLPLAERAGDGACDYLAIRLPDGSYTDDMGSRLTLRTQPDGTYLVDFGIYKLCWVEDAPGAWEAGILHFEGTDDSGQPLSANVTAREGGLLLTVAESGHPDCPAGTEFQFAPAE